MDELRAALADLCPADAAPPDLAAPDRGEQLTTLMLLLRRDQKLPVQVRLEKLLREILSTPLQPAEWTIVVHGVRQLLDVYESQRLAGAVVMVTEALRRSDASLPLLFLRDVCRGGSASRLASLWPFLVNELLLTGRRTDPDAFKETCAMAAEVPDAAMRSGLSQAEHLEALRDRNVAVDLFLPPPPELFGVFAVLLESAQSRLLGKRLVTGLRRTPPSWIAAAVLPLVERFTPRHRDFLVELMRQQQGKGSAVKLTQIAGRIVAEGLAELPASRRKEPWVASTIRAVARLPVPDGQALLRRIATDRRWFVLPEWPGHCRAAARHALADPKATNV
jgi:hypothetical protein